MAAPSWESPSLEIDLLFSMIIDRHRRLFMDPRRRANLDKPWSPIPSHLENFNPTSATSVSFVMPAPKAAKPSSPMSLQPTQLRRRRWSCPRFARPRPMLTREASLMVLQSMKFRSSSLSAAQPANVSENAVKSCPIALHPFMFSASLVKPWSPTPSIANPPSVIFSQLSTFSSRTCSPCSALRPLQRLMNPPSSRLKTD
mmetsp:Transcript_94518/g.252876  ORF Transcript_94518/g.252876 Transcript_94518/m.252876 type:complete len:200 (-) Transcript_94518:814-1413(-)